MSKQETFDGESLPLTRLATKPRGSTVMLSAEAISSMWSLTLRPDVKSAAMREQIVRRSTQLRARAAKTASGCCVSGRPPNHSEHIEEIKNSIVVWAASYGVTSGDLRMIVRVDFGGNAGSAAGLLSRAQAVARDRALRR